MNLLPVKSSNIAAVGYDAEARVMGVQFTNGTTYHYPEVAPEVHADLVGAESVGKAFASLRKAGLTGVRVEPKAEG